MTYADRALLHVFASSLSPDHRKSLVATIRWARLSRRAHRQLTKSLREGWGTPPELAAIFRHRANLAEISSFLKGLDG